MAQRQQHCDTNRLRLLLEDSLPQTRQAEVVYHLDSCQECQQALEQLAADKRLWAELPGLSDLQQNDPRRPELAGWATATSVEPMPAPAEGENGPFALDFLDPPGDPAHLGKLDRFAVTEVLGRGGMGMVLKALDPALNRSVAIKVMAPYFASSGAARKRFDREAKAAATVVHPNVVAIHTVATWKGLPYLVMSYISGRSLQERLDHDGPLEIKEVLQIGLQTASGLAAAHAQGLVHRDVKPSNVLLENDVGRVWLTDFGLARAVDDASLTQSGVIAGTPQYMAPEQAQGLAIDHRADLFSLGSTLYAMCTAHPPFRAESAMAVLWRVCDDQPRTVRSINPDVPIWLAGIINKLHAKNPADRFQSASQVANLLEKCLAHLQQPDIIALPDEVTILVPREKGRKRWKGWAAALICALFLATLGTIWGRARWTNNHPPFSKSRGTTPVKRVVTARVSNPGPADDSLESQVQGMENTAEVLNEDLKQHFVEGFGDPTGPLLDELHRRLETLEKEISSPSP